MANLAKLLSESILLIVASIAIGFLFLVGAYSIPTERIESNVVSSVEILKNEGNWPKVWYLGVGNKLDNYSDAIMLMTAAYQKQSDIIDRALNGYRPSLGNQSPTETISFYFSGDKEKLLKAHVVSYARYWQGYLIVLKPLLTIFTYEQIRVFNAFVVFALAAFMVMLLYLKRMGPLIIPYLITLLFVDPIAISKSMQFMSDYCIFSIASISLLIWKASFVNNKNRVILLFLLIGCVTSYFDLLSYPFITFGIPIAIYSYTSQKSLKEGLQILFLALVFWSIGYIGLWIGKWIISALLVNQNIISDVISAVLHRTSLISDSGKHISIFFVILKQLVHLIAPSVLLAVVYIIVAVRRLKTLPGKFIPKDNWVLFIIISLLPFLWYLGTSNHSYVHNWTAFRELAISLFSVLCIFSSAYSNQPPNRSLESDICACKTSSASGNREA